MSKTPICDKWKYETNQGVEVVALNVAESLELAGRSYDPQLRELERQNSELLALVEQMRTALIFCREVIKNGDTAFFSYQKKYTDFEKGCFNDFNFALRRIEAALSAANLKSCPAS